jgi:hypothetical protein
MFTNLKQALHMSQQTILFLANEKTDVNQFKNLYIDCKWFLSSKEIDLRGGKDVNVKSSFFQQRSPSWGSGQDLFLLSERSQVRATVQVFLSQVVMDEWSVHSV